MLEDQETMSQLAEIIIWGILPAFGFFAGVISACLGGDFHE